MQARLKRVLLYAAGTLTAGLLYALLIAKIGFGIPCMFYLLTGMECASCGISRMCMALLQFRFAEAFAYNPAIFCLLPLGAAVGIAWTVQYVRTGRTKMRRWMNIAVIFMIIVLILFGIARNLV
ncbi:MAG: DUF2752 domain-containing protein [Clostridia bacterium]|nr:DUF2752 domain-containing protein [Clostridia bacterium]